MKNKIFLMVTVPVAAGAIALGFLMSRPVVEKPMHQPEKVSAVTPPAPVEPAPVTEEIVSVVTAVRPPALKTATVDKPVEQFALIPNAPKAPKPPLQDPDARAALSLVGADPDAEAYWLSAISDTSLPEEERADLMEDLNEDGLSDPKNPGPEDLPLIMNRITLIENIAPQADPFMQEHLAEAHKDLLNMLDGRPVQ